MPSLSQVNVCLCVCVADFPQLSYTTFGSHEQMAEVMCCKKSNKHTQRHVHFSFTTHGMNLCLGNIPGPTHTISHRHIHNKPTLDLSQKQQSINQSPLFDLSFRLVSCILESSGTESPVWWLVSLLGCL